jgi:hypothetical protein
VRENQYAICRKRCIPTDVIGVDMSVNQESDFAVTQFSNSGYHVFGMRFKLRVNKQYTLITNEHADIREPVRSLNHVHTSRDWHDSEFNVEEVFANLGYSREWSERREQGN